MLKRESTAAIVGALLGLLLLGVPEASAQPALSPCVELPGFLCGRLEVPVSRAGLAAGTIGLQVAVLPAAVPTESAVVALAGGPGQAALPFAEVFAQEVEPALGNRDLIVFDQRGTGASNPLHCKALGHRIEAIDQLQAALGTCAREIGPARGGYTTVESVADIEAIRQAFGLRKLVLYGTSYGTKVALRYAELHPDAVEALLLDSVVPPQGPEPLFVPSFEAITPVLDELCSQQACRGIASEPVAELARLAARLRVHPLRGFIFNGRGGRERITVDAAELFDLLLAGDLNPALRALFPAALTAALRGEPAALLQLEAIADGLLPTLPPVRHEHVEEAVDAALFWTTTCEEEPFPWQRQAPPRQRAQEAREAVAKLPASDFYPFFPALGLTAGPIAGCEGWPNASPPPPPPQTLPDVPTLILSGGQDLRTPTAQARALAARIPDAQLLVVPYTGHSVLGSDLSGCANIAVVLFFAGEPVGSCPQTTDPFAPTPIPPRSLALLKPLPGVAGRRGRTLTAVVDTFLALGRIAVAATLQAEQELPAGASFGGLHGGYARFAANGLRLERFSFVPGVCLTGLLPLRDGRLEPRPIKVEGSAAVHGSVVLRSGRISGRLGGKRFDVALARGTVSRRGLAPRSVGLVRIWRYGSLLGLGPLTRTIGRALPALVGGALRWR